MREKMKQKLKKSKSIFSIILCLALVVTGVVLLGTYMLYTSNANLQSEEEKRNNYREKAEILADSSDYLTREVRLFALTGEMEHFENYWREAKETKRRELVIEAMDQAGIPETEERYLSKAKYFSDTLMHIEICSMQLTLQKFKIDIKDYKQDAFLTKWISYVQEYPQEADYMCKSEEEMEEKCIQILFGSVYEKYKTLIDGYIEKFQESMNSRLDTKVERTIEESQRASVMQIFFGILEFFVLLTIIYVMKKLYIEPLIRYTNSIEKQNGKRQIFVEPEGVWELEQFGEAFNILSWELTRELEKREEAKQELQLAKQEAEEANQVKGDFLAQISHEIRTPLNAVMGYLYLLEETKLSGEQQRYAGNMHLAVDVLMEEINEILDYSKIEAGKMTYERKNFDFYHLIEELNSMLENEAKQRNLQLQMHISPQVPQYLVGDALRLKQVLTNLLFNGLKFTKEGSVRLEVNIRKKRKESCTLEFVVQDTGIGIPKKMQRDIFEAFSQGDASITRKYGGTGLGLPICKRIVEEMSREQYTLLLESEENKGSRFCFYLDFLYGKESAKQKKKKSKSRARKEQPDILLVDDNEINLVLEEEVFHKFGYRVDVESDPRQVVPRMEKKNYGIVFLDISMPEISGYDVSKMIRRQEKWKNTIIIAITANIGDDVIKKVKQAGMNDYLPKPIPMERLKQMLEQYTEEEIVYEVVESMEEDGLVSFGKLEQQLYDDKNAVQELLTIFKDDNQMLKEKLTEQVKQMNWEAMEIELHRLVGVSSNLQCKPLKQAARKCMDKVKAKEKFQEEMEQMFLVFDQTMEAIEAYRKENG